ncbi:MAG: pyruvate formate lyase family protein [Mangrovibacterium sp.]
MITKNKRIQLLHERALFLAQNHKRDIYVDNPEFLVYHWSGKAAAFSPATGELAAPVSERINIGDHNCRIDNGIPFPKALELPSKVNGFSYDAGNFADDYAFFLDNCPVIIHPHERIAGEFNWQLDEARYFQYPDENRQLGMLARKMGAGGISFTHTCPDLSIGLELGWGELLEKIKHYKVIYQANGQDERAAYLTASEKICRSIIGYVDRYSQTATRLAEEETDPELKENYRIVADTCKKITYGKPGSFIEAVQWINFYQIAERIIGHGNGYGRLDQLLIGFYNTDLAKGILTHEYARDLIAELYLKYAGNYFSFGGRNRELKDATNEVSRIGLEAYDMLGGYNQLGAMWHSDIDPDFWNYACDVVGRHGCGAPTLVNYDVMRASEIRSGYSEEDSWNISYSGCQWYCSVGKEYNDQDVNSLVLIQPMQRAIGLAAEYNTNDWDRFWQLYCKEVDRTSDVLVTFKNNTYQWQPKVWPEMVTSFCIHGCIEKGKDCTDCDSVPNAYTSVNVLGVPNVADSMYAMKVLVFDQKKYSMGELQEALRDNWKDREFMRQEFLRQPKFGNDIDAVDAMAVKISTQIREVLERKKNLKGFHFRPSLFQFMGHTYAGPMMGATPDGRLAEEPLAHGMNPMHGRNQEGMMPTMRSFTKINYAEYQGGSFQVELHPSFFGQFPGKGDLVEVFATGFFEMGGVQINLNVVDVETLKKAMENPDKAEYKGIVVKVTGYSAHFAMLDRKFQEEFIKRVNYQNLGNPA